MQFVVVLHWVWIAFFLVLDCNLGRKIGDHAIISHHVH